jgi:hypothetical protein
MFTSHARPLLHSVVAPMYRFIGAPIAIAKVCCMSQNIISLAWTDAQLSEMDQALTSLEALLEGLASLTPTQVRALTKMGDKSEAFVRQTTNVLTMNPQVLPPSFNLTEMQGDLRALDQLRPRMARLERLIDRADDTAIALGSDLMAAALEGYALLKVSGRNQGLDSLRQELSARFRKGSTADTPSPEAPQPTGGNP